MQKGDHLALIDEGRNWMSYDESLWTDEVCLQVLICAVWASATAPLMSLLPGRGKIMFIQRSYLGFSAMEPYRAVHRMANLACPELLTALHSILFDFKLGTSCSDSIAPEYGHVGNRPSE